MVREAEAFAAEDQRLRKKAEARRQLEDLIFDIMDGDGRASARRPRARRGSRRTATPSTASPPGAPAPRPSCSGCSRRTTTGGARLRGERAATAGKILPRAVHPLEQLPAAADRCTAQRAAQRSAAQQRWRTRRRFRSGRRTRRSSDLPRRRRLWQVLTERLADKAYSLWSRGAADARGADEIKGPPARRTPPRPPPRPHRTPAADAQPPTPTHHRHATAQQAEERARAAALQVCGAGRHRRGPRRVRARVPLQHRTPRRTTTRRTPCRRRAAGSATGVQPDTAAISRRPPAPRRRTRSSASRPPTGIPLLM